MCPVVMAPIVTQDTLWSLVANAVPEHIVWGSLRWSRCNWAGPQRSLAGQCLCMQAKKFPGPDVGSDPTISQLAQAKMNACTTPEHTDK